MTRKRKPAGFEASLQELEGLVESMERGEMTLEEALASFERGVALTRSCREALEAAEQRVAMLTAEGRLEPMAPPPAEAAPEAPDDGHA
jgi:exodeoxyribonuclease VII small subunit